MVKVPLGASISQITVLEFETCSAAISDFNIVHAGRQEVPGTHVETNFMIFCTGLNSGRTQVEAIGK